MMAKTWHDFLKSLEGEKVRLRWTTGMGAYEGTVMHVGEDYVSLADENEKELVTPISSILNVDGGAAN